MWIEPKSLVFSSNYFSLFLPSKVTYSHAFNYHWCFLLPDLRLFSWLLCWAVMLFKYVLDFTLWLILVLSTFTSNLTYLFATFVLAFRIFYHKRMACYTSTRQIKWFCSGLLNGEISPLSLLMKKTAISNPLVLYKIIYVFPYLCTSKRLLLINNAWYILLDRENS